MGAEEEPSSSPSPLPAANIAKAALAITTDFAAAANRGPNVFAPAGSSTSSGGVFTFGSGGAVKIEDDGLDEAAVVSGESAAAAAAAAAAGASVHRIPAQWDRVRSTWTPNHHAEPHHHSRHRRPARRSPPPRSASDGLARLTLGALPCLTEPSTASTVTSTSTRPSARSPPIIGLRLTIMTDHPGLGDPMTAVTSVEELDDESFSDDEGPSIKSPSTEPPSGTSPDAAAGGAGLGGASGEEQTSLPVAGPAKRPRGRPRKQPVLSPDAQINIAKGRSKTGCITCRRRKKKCDETKPQCA